MAYPPNVLLPSAGAHLAHGDLTEVATHVEEDYRQAVFIERGYTGPMDQIVVQPPASEAEAVCPPVFLLRQNGATQAYARTDKEEISMKHRHPRWGSIIFAVVYVHVHGNVFQAPLASQAVHVAIKRVNKRVVDEYMRRGGNENPYKEIARMQELGDNVHVLEPIEVLEDDENLFIVMPKACEEGTLKDAINWYDSENVMCPQRIHKIFCKILQILIYLERHGINHHDMSPDNFLFLTENNLVVFDLALSVRIPANPITGKRKLIAHEPPYGTFAWMPPEVFHQHDYDGVAMDLWSATVILYNLWTNHVLYESPCHTNFSFKYFVLSNGLSSTPLNERTLDLLQSVQDPSSLQSNRLLDELIAKATAHLNLPPNVIELFEKLLNVNPRQRWSLAQTFESNYVQSNKY